jgi:hypothetical protein
LHISRKVDDVEARIWAVLGSLRVNTSATRIVVGSKALHHVLPDLVPPIDRQYTFQFLTGQKAVTTGDERAFLARFPHLAEISRRAAPDIQDVLDRGGFMATGAAKVVDNASLGQHTAAPRSLRAAVVGHLPYELLRNRELFKNARGPSDFAFHVSMRVRLWKSSLSDSHEVPRRWHDRAV